MVTLSGTIPTIAPRPRGTSSLWIEGYQEMKYVLNSA